MSMMLYNTKSRSAGHYKQEQVAQSATIAHLSPMCHGQISLKKPNNIQMDHGNQRPESELVRAFMPVLLPATLMMIRSKMNEQAWRHHFPIISL